MKNKKVIIIISILISLLICLIVYILIAKKQSIKDNNNPSTTAKLKEEISLIILLVIAIIMGFLLIFFLEKNEDLVIFDNSKVTHQIDNSDIAKILYKVTSSYGSCNSGYVLDYKNKNTLLVTDLEENFKYNIIYNILKTKNKIVKQYENKNKPPSMKEQPSILDENKYTEILLINDINEVYESLFGVKPQTNINTFTLGTRVYSLKNNIYTTDVDESVEEKCSKRIKYSIYSSTSSKERITLDYILYFSDNDNFNVYADENLQNKITNLGNENNYIDNFIKYRFIFIGNNDSYSLQSIVLI